MEIPLLRFPYHPQTNKELHVGPWLKETVVLPGPLLGAMVFWGLGFRQVSSFVLPTLCWGFCAEDQLLQDCPMSLGLKGLRRKVYFNLRDPGVKKHIISHCSPLFVGYLTNEYFPGSHKARQNSKT